jgi:site-specific DNA-cytosine methylase
MHIDLFSGIGGFSLACQWNGIQTEVFCEKDERCRSFLERTYPGVPVLPDIREFDGTRWRGRFILTAGVPCQPASRAGKQRGKADDRWLWGEALRVVGEALPAWCLFENPPGIYDVGIDGILSDLAGIGYEVGLVEIPACAVNSPQIRQRVWIMAHLTRDRERRVRPETRTDRERVGEHAESCGMASPKSLRHEERRGPGGVAASEDGGVSWTTITTGAESILAHSLRDRRRSDEQGERPQGRDADGRNREGNVADTQECGWRQGSEDTGRTREGEGEKRERLRSTNGPCPQWDSFVWVPCADGKLRRAPDDSFSLADGLHRSVLAALGNSIVPQVAFEIIKAIKNA